MYNMFTLIGIAEAFLFGLFAGAGLWTANRVLSKIFG